MSEEEFIESTVKAIPLPADVKSVDYEYSEDWTGAPCVNVRLHVAPDNRPSKAKITRLTDATLAIRDKLLDLHVKRWPYVMILED